MKKSNDMANQDGSKITKWDQQYPSTFNSTRIGFSNILSAQDVYGNVDSCREDDTKQTHSTAELPSLSLTNMLFQAG